MAEYGSGGERVSGVDAGGQAGRGAAAGTRVGRGIRTGSLSGVSNHVRDSSVSPTLSIPHHRAVACDSSVPVSVRRESVVVLWQWVVFISWLETIRMA